MTDPQNHVVAGTAPAEYEEIDDPHYEALERTGFFGEQAAGTVTIAADTGRMMLTLRSAKVLQPGTYGNAGGAYHADEDPEAAARREHREETGWEGAVLATIPALVFRKDAFVYRNFFTVVPHEFEPELGWEADSAVWCTTEDLPSPLHFGIEALLADEASRQIVEGGWRRFVTENLDDLPHIEWTLPSGEESAIPTNRRPLSPEVLDRISSGLAKCIGASDAAVAFFKDMADRSPPTWEFELILATTELPDDAMLDRIYEAGCDDAIVGIRSGVVSISFAREAADMRTAVETAMQDVVKTGLGISTVRIDGIGDVVSLTDLSR